MRKVTHLFIALCTIIGMSACAGTGGVSTNPADMVGNWELGSEASSEYAQESGDQFTLSFNRDGTVAGIAGCNRFAGEFSTAQGEEEEGTVTIEPIASTRVACTGEQVDDSFVSMVDSIQRFEVHNGNELVLYSQDNREMVLTRAQPEEEG